jgi:hypothetical protein
MRVSVVLMADQDASFAWYHAWNMSIAHSAFE